jgi:hypothetical protein
MRIALEHLHGLVAGNRGDFHIAQVGVLEKPAGCLVSQIVKVQIGDNYVLACFGKRVGYRPTRLDGECPFWSGRCWLGPIQRFMQGNAFGFDPTELEPPRVNLGFYLAGPGDSTHFGLKSRAGAD